MIQFLPMIFEAFKGQQAGAEKAEGDLKDAKAANDAAHAGQAPKADPPAPQDAPDAAKAYDDARAGPD